MGFQKNKKCKKLYVFKQKNVDSERRRWRADERGRRWHLTPEHIVGGVFREPCAPNPKKKLGECHDRAVIIITMEDCQGIRPWALCRRIEQATGMLGYPHDFECTVSIFN